MDQKSKIAILGFGLEGKAVLDYLLHHGYGNVTVCDKNVDLKADMPDGVSVILGPHYMNQLFDFDVVFRSPGIPYLTPVIQSAKANGVEITSCTAFFMDQCPCTVIGVTGTKGKGTTSTLIYEMLKKGDRNVFLGGNIGTPALEFLDKVEGDDLVVLELSSFQLQDLTKSPKVAVLLNTTSDHLDYHADVEEYLAAKEALLAHQDNNDLAVLNKDYEYINNYKNLVKGNLMLVSTKSKVVDGAFAEAGGVYYVEYEDSELICPISDVRLIGSHNLENVLPAVAVAKHFKIKNKDIAEVLKEFRGLPHRLEFVRETDNIFYYNDSFSTTPDTSIAAVESFEEPTILIAGGADKGADYSEWATKILTRLNLEGVVLVGDTAERMEAAIEDAKAKLGEAEATPTKVMKAHNLKAAVEKARAELSGGVVVMSPASSSFDLYKNYKERGQIFRDVVNEI